jgi:hypothetical protein
LGNSKVSLGLAAVILALLGTLAWITFFGTSNLTPKLTADNYAQGSNKTVADAAYSLAGGHTATSYRGVTLHAIVAYVTNPYLGGYAKVSVTTGAVVRSSYFGSVKRKGVRTPGMIAIVSVDLCADGNACQEIIVASKGVGKNCWYERQTVGDRSIARKEHLRIGYEYQASSASVCKASNAPRSGWTPGWPNS